MFRSGCSASVQVYNYGSLVLVRGIRMKGRNRLLSLNSQKEDDIFLERLETQYERLKVRLAKEEEAKRKAGTDHMHRAPQPEPAPETATPPPRPLDSHNLSLWDEVVSKDDQRKLAAHGIKSMDELQTAYQEADADLNRPPYPAVQRLRPRLRLAYELYKAIPQKLAFKRPKPN